ncbi:hypothetical protein [Stenotrophomonas sp.]|uniref:hypothetical protein n=1 Tax=Stenotrophomonas sp. TaxID=69392 RepID=UPI002FC97BCD
MRFPTPCLKRPALPALLLGIFISGCSHSQPVEGTVKNTMQPDATAPTHAPSATDAAQGLATLAAQFRYYAENRLLDFRYTLTNTSGEALAVFDRGSVGRTLEAVGPTGKVARPTISVEQGDVTVSFQAASPDPQARLLALELAPGGRVQVEAWETLAGTGPITRVRVCVPVARLRDGQFEGAIENRDGLVRVASTAPHPQLLCSAWVAVNNGAADWTG